MKEEFVCCENCLYYHMLSEVYEENFEFEKQGPCERCVNLSEFSQVE